MKREGLNNFYLYLYTTLMSVHLCAQCLDPFFIIVKEALCDIYSDTTTTIIATAQWAKL